MGLKSDSAPSATVSRAAKTTTWDTEWQDAAGTFWEFWVVVIQSGHNYGDINHGQTGIQRNMMKWLTTNGILLYGDRSISLERRPVKPFSNRNHSLLHIRYTLRQSKLASWFSCENSEISQPTMFNYRRAIPLSHAIIIPTSIHFFIACFFTNYSPNYYPKYC